MLDQGAQVGAERLGSVFAIVDHSVSPWPRWSRATQ